MTACICNSISQEARAARLCVQGQPDPPPHTHTHICQLVNNIVGKRRRKTNRNRMCVTRKDDE